MTNANVTNLLDEANSAKNKYDFSKAIQLYTAVLDETEANSAQAEIVELRLKVLRERALLQGRMGNQEAALASAQQYRQEAQTPQQTAVGLELVAQQRSYMGQHERALSLHKQALHTAENINYTYGRALALQGLGSTAFYQGRFDEATSTMEKSLSLFRQLGDAEEISRNWNWLGIIYQRQGKTDKCISAYSKALELARDVGEMETAVVLSNLGESYQYLYAMEQALMYHQEALVLAEKVKMPTMEVDTRRNLGFEQAYLGQMDEGIENLRQSLRLSEVVGRPFLTFQVLYSISLAEQMRGNLSKAEEYGQRLLVLAEENDARDFQAQALHALGLIAQSYDDNIKAEQYWQQGLFLAHETGQQTLLWQLHAALAAISAPALTSTHYRIAAEVIEQIIYPIEDEDLRQTFLTAVPIKTILDHAQN